jgi:hypothetical protein
MSHQRTGLVHRKHEEYRSSQEISSTEKEKENCSETTNSTVKRFHTFRRHSITSSKEAKAHKAACIRRSQSSLNTINKASSLRPPQLSKTDKNSSLKKKNSAVWPHTRPNCSIKAVLIGCGLQQNDF